MGAIDRYLKTIGKLPGQAYDIGDNLLSTGAQGIESGMNILNTASGAGSKFIKGVGNLGENVIDKAASIPDGANGLLNLITGTSGLGSVLGAGQALADNLFGGSEQQRIREKEVDEALLQNLGNRERLLSRNPEAERRLASMQVQNAMSGAQGAAMNAAAGQGQYSGGDVNFAAGAGARSSAMAQGAASPYAQQLAGLYGQKSQDEAQIAGQLDQNTMQRGQLAEMTAYMDKEKDNPFANLLTGAWKGAGIAHGISDMTTRKKKVEADADGNVSLTTKSY